jgi:hypothetical protein
VPFIVFIIVLSPPSIDKDWSSRGGITILSSAALSSSGQSMAAMTMATPNLSVVVRR